MIHPHPGVAFSLAPSGDMRASPTARRDFSSALQLPDGWARVRQNHGKEVRMVAVAGDAGEADALFTTTPNLPLAVFTADCAGVALLGESGVGVAHVGWRGQVAGIVAKLLTEMLAEGIEVQQIVIGPTIGPCCFEVGEEVWSQFGGFVHQTRWGTPSVDLPAAIAATIPTQIETHLIRHCTAHNLDCFSHRSRHQTERMVALTWLP